MKSKTLNMIWILPAATAFAAAVVSVGCGGGGMSSGIAGSAAAKGAVAYSTVVSLLTPAQRQVTMTAATTALAAVPTNENGLQNPQIIVAALKGIKGVLNPQAQANGSVTAQFADGLPFTIFNDRPTAAKSRAVEDQPETRSAEPMAQTRTVPAGGNVCFENALKSSYNTLNTSKAATAFASTHDYKPPIVGTTTVAELRALGSAELGVLYLAAHGGTVEYAANPPNGTKTSLGYGISTSTPWSTTTASEYAADYADHTLGLGFADNTWTYCITPKFISTYKWSFSKDSFIILDTSSNGELDTTDTGTFRAALFTAGASVVAEWPAAAAYGGNATGFLLDRMLGTNVIVPVNKDYARPLSLTDSLTDLKMFTTLNGEPVDMPTPYLNPATNGEQFTALLPTISSESIVGTTLTLLGEFGIPGGHNTTVSVGGKAASLVAVSSTELTCTLPSTTPPSLRGPQKVYATVKTTDGRALKSNTVELTIVTGRWDAVGTSGGFSGDYGMLITSQTETTASGSFDGCPLFNVSISGNSFKCSYTQTETGHPTDVASMTVGDSTMTGTFTRDNQSFGPVSFSLESSSPTSPYTGRPTVLASSIIWEPHIKEYAVVLRWSRPMAGFWDVTIVQVTGTGGNTRTNTIYCATCRDTANFSYVPGTETGPQTFTMPMTAAAGLVPGPCTLSMQGSSDGAEWQDSYGVVAWTSLAQGYSANLVAPNN